MSFSVDKLLSQTQEFASPARYFFQLSGPSIVHAGAGPEASPPPFLQPQHIPRALAEGLLCHQITLPARSLTTSDEYRHGPPRKVATAVNFSDLDASFYWTGTNKETCREVHRFFTKWQSYIVGREDDGTQSGYDMNSFYGPAYYENYVLNADLKVYSPQSAGVADPLETFRFYELYPLTLNPIQFSWSSQAEVLSFTVSFTYRVWETV